MKGFINFLWSGFGLGVTPARAVGIALLVVSFGFIAIYYIISWTIGLFRKKQPAE